MDLEILFYIAFALIYFVLQALGSKKRKEQAKARQRTGDSEPTLDDALREIRVAMGMEAPPTEASPVPQDPRPTPPPVREFSPPEVAMREEPRPDLSSDLEALKTRLKKKHRPETVSVPAQAVPLPALPATPVVSSERSPALGTIHDWLRDPDAVREAYVLSEILGPPRSRQRRS